MEISKSTPYVRYRENISSTLHKGTIHIESEYLDRERKTTIESIEGQTWQNMVNGENKEEDILPRLGLKIEGNEDVLDGKEQHMPIDTIIGDVEPVANEDGTYTYEISTMEGSYAKTLDGENNFSLTSDGLVGDMYIKYNAQGEEVNENIVMDNWQSSHTIEKSNNGEIKSAIFKGQTLVNLAKYELSTSLSEMLCYQDFSLQKNNTAYTLFNLTDKPIIFNTYNTSIWRGFETVEANSKRLLTLNDFTINEVIGRAANGWDKTTETEKFLNGYMIIEGDYTNVDIPYFEGMQSVKMPVLATTGKNLFNINDNFEMGNIDKEGKISLSDRSNSFERKNNGFSVNVTSQYGGIVSNYIEVNQNTEYLFIFNQIGNFVTQANIVFYNKDKEVIGCLSDNRLAESFTTPPSCSYLRVGFWSFNAPRTICYEDIQLQKTPVESSYEPFKSNILTVNEDVTLRGIGDVQDELDLETSTLTQRVGEVVLDGSEDETYNTVVTSFNGSSNTIIEFIPSENLVVGSENSYTNAFLSNYNYKQFFDANWITDTSALWGVYLGVTGNKTTVRIIVADGTTYAEVRQHLQENPLRIVCKLETPTVKTVDLTIKDQDDKIIQSLHTHPSTTHINLSSDGLIPSAELSYTMYGNIGETTGEQITDGTDSKLIEGKIYGETLQNVLPSASLKNSMDYNTSMQKLNDGYDNVIITDVEFKEVTLYGQTMVNIEGIKSVENPTIIITNSPMRFGKGGRK